MQPLEHRFSESDAPYPWAVGKTVKEAMDMSQGAFQTLQTFSPPTQAEPAKVNAPLQNASLGPPDPQLQYDNPAEYSRQMDAYVTQRSQAQFAQQAEKFAAPMMQQMKQTSRTLASQNPEVADIFSRYGPEIDNHMASVDPQYSTVDAYIKVAKMVKGDHIDEFINAALEKRSNIAVGTISGDTPAGPTEPSMPKDSVDEFWESGHNYVNRLKEDGINKTKLRESIKLMGLTPEAYIETIKNGNMISTLGGRYVTTQTLIPKDRS